MRNETNQKFVLPKKVKRDNRRDYISRELHRVYLVEENFFFLIHAMIVTPGHHRRARTDYILIERRSLLADIVAKVFLHW
jgi:hypothetical protein